MKVTHVQSTDIWMLSKGNKVLYRGRTSPWRSPKVIAYALKREAKLLKLVA